MGHWWVWYGFRLTTDISNLSWESLPGRQALKPRSAMAIFVWIKVGRNFTSCRLGILVSRQCTDWISGWARHHSMFTCDATVKLLFRECPLLNPKPLRLYWSRSGRPVIVILGKAWKGKSSLGFGLQDFLRQNAESDTPSGIFDSTMP